jgi:hypothetical protein
VCAFSGGRARSSVLGVRPSASIRLRCWVPGSRCQIAGTRYLVPGTGHQVECPSHASKNPHTECARLVPSKPRGPRPILAGPPPPPPPGPRDHHLGIDASRPPPRVSTCGHPSPTPSLRATAVSADGTSGSPLQTPCHSGQKPLRSGSTPDAVVSRVDPIGQIVWLLRHPDSAFPGSIAQSSLPTHPPWNTYPCLKNLTLRTARVQSWPRMPARSPAGVTPSPRQPRVARPVLPPALKNF